MPATAMLPKLTIVHNHGVCILTDVEVEVYESRCYTSSGKRDGEPFTGHRVRGTVVDGGDTARLFTATSYTPYPVGEPMEWDLYGRCINETERGHRVDVTFC